mmetsp:Transcript_82710/g.189062  ORF Transcript_82710/g.189062 Transcript_82710/m.189062 type:complete len:200 (-) Transcript_82710:1944-2543(-)
MLTADPVESSQLRPRSERAWNIWIFDTWPPLSYGEAYSESKGVIHVLILLHSVQGSAAAAQLVSRRVLAKKMSLWYAKVPAAVRCDSIASSRRCSASRRLSGRWSSPRSSAIRSSSDWAPVSTSPALTCVHSKPSSAGGPLRADMKPPRVTGAGSTASAVRRRDATVAPPITYSRLSLSTTAVAPKRWLMVVDCSVGTS